MANALSYERINLGFFNLRRAQEAYKMCQKDQTEFYLSQIPDKLLKETKEHIEPKANKRSIVSELSNLRV